MSSLESELKTVEEKTNEQEEWKTKMKDNFKDKLSVYTGQVMLDTKKYKENKSVLKEKTKELDQVQMENKIK